jgi:hypothetical protein
MGYNRSSSWSFLTSGISPDCPLRTLILFGSEYRPLYVFEHIWILPGIPDLEIGREHHTLFSRGHGSKAPKDGIKGI